MPILGLLWGARTHAEGVARKGPVRAKEEDRA